jgi:hypothetical protein
MSELTAKEEDALMRKMLRGIISIAAGEQQAVAMFDNPQSPSGACQTINRMIDYTKKFIRENAE